MSSRSSRRRASPPSAKVKEGAAYWMVGRHAVVAALINPKRTCLKVLTTEAAHAKLAQEEGVKTRLDTCAVEVVRAEQIDQHVAGDTPHQGMALLVQPLPQPSLKQLCEGGRHLVLLDQVSDPQNIGAILRSAGAFGAGGVVLPAHGAPGETQALAKAASGVLEHVPLCVVKNLAQAMGAMQKQGYWLVGMDGHVEMKLDEAPSYDKVGLVMGAEGKGLRTRTRELCDLLVRLPMAREVESLNVSAAAAVALYALRSV